MKSLIIERVLKMAEGRAALSPGPGPAGLSHVKLQPVLRWHR